MGAPGSGHLSRTLCCHLLWKFNTSTNIICRQKWAAVPSSVDDNHSDVPSNRTHADVSYLSNLVMLLTTISWLQSSQSLGLYHLAHNIILHACAKGGNQFYCHCLPHGIARSQFIGMGDWYCRKVIPIQVLDKAYFLVGPIYQSLLLISCSVWLCAHKVNIGKDCYHKVCGPMLCQATRVHRVCV